MFLCPLTFEHGGHAGEAGVGQQSLNCMKTDFLLSFSVLRDPSQPPPASVLSSEGCCEYYLLLGAGQRCPGTSLGPFLHLILPATLCIGVFVPILQMRKVVLGGDLGRCLVHFSDV